MADLPVLAGRAVAVPLRALAWYRRGKPMHPRGVVLEGELERSAGPAATGVPWLDGPARERVTVRMSRGAGLPGGLPDLLGLAIRVPGAVRPVDLLLTTTGSGRFTRRLPVPRRDAAAAYGSIMGYRSPAGTLQLAALPAPGTGPLPSDPAPLAAVVVARRPEFVLAIARGAGPWHRFGRLVLAGPVAGFDPDIGFDPVRHPPPGLVADGPMARFRAPAYSGAREGRTRARRAGSRRPGGR